MNKYSSIYGGIVEDNKDPKNLGRVRITIPSVTTEFVSEWAWPAVNVAGVLSGRFEPPAEGSTCFVMFMEGDIEVPIYMGGYWPEPDGVPETPEEFRRDIPTNRGYKSPGGHLIEYDDAEDTQAIRLTSINGMKVHLDDANKLLCLETPDGNKFCLDDENEQVTLESIGDFILTIAGDENRVVDGDMNYEAANINFTANSNISLEGTNVEIIASASAKFEGTGGTDVGSSGSATNVNGSVVNLGGGGAPVARLGDTAIGTGAHGVPVVSNIVSGSGKVFSA